MKITVEQVIMMLTNILEKQQDQLDQQRREIKYCQRKIELLEHTNMALSNHIYTHLHAIEAVTEYDYLTTIVEDNKE